MALKTYLSQGEREKLVFLWFMSGYIEDMLEKWTEIGNMTKEEHKYLKMSNTYTTKFVTAVLDRINEKEGKRIYNKLIGSRIEIKPIIPHVEGNTSDKPTWTFKIDREAMDTIAEGVIAAWCKNCKEEDYEECPIRYIFEQTEVEKYDKFAKGCQYKY